VKRKFRAATLTVAMSALVFTGVASAHAPQTITIRHRLRGCHMWSIANGPYKASLRITADRDATSAGGRSRRGDL